MKIIIDSVELKKGKTRGRSEVEKEKTTREKGTERKQRETDMSAKTIFIACPSLASAGTSRINCGP